MTATFGHDSHFLIIITIITLNIGTDMPEQTVQTKIRCCILQHLTSVYTVCHPSSTILDASTGI